MPIEEVNFFYSYSCLQWVRERERERSQSNHQQQDKETLQLTAWLIALWEWITNKASNADADGNMVVDPTVGVDATQAWTGVLTLLVGAGLVRGTVWVDDTLRPAVGWWANHFGAARALTTVPNNTRRITFRATGIGLAGIICHNRFNS